MVNVDSKTLGLLGLSYVYCSDTVADLDLFNLFTELKKEQTAHTWQRIENLTSNNCFKKLDAFEQAKRPTKFFFYFGVYLDGKKELLAVGTIAEKISHQFTESGFPVLARCYIVKKYRNNRLYEPVLRHRYDYCLKAYGEKLKGIHLGSQSPKIYQVVKKHIFPLPFVYIGNELLKLRQHSEFVRDYLCFSNNFIKQVHEELDSMSTSFKTDRYKELFSKLLNNQFEVNSYGQLCEVLKSEYLSPFPIKNKYPSIDVLIQMFEAIGVIKDPQEIDEVSEINSMRRVS